MTDQDRLETIARLGVEIKRAKTASRVQLKEWGELIVALAIFPPEFLELERNKFAKYLPQERHNDQT